MAVQGQELRGIGLRRGETRDAKRDLVFGFVVRELEAVTRQAEDLRGMGELQVARQRGAGPDTPRLDAPVALGGLSVLRGEERPAGDRRCPAGGWADCP